MNILIAILSLLPIIGVGDFFLRRLSLVDGRPLAQRWPLALALGGGWITMLLFGASLLAFPHALKITVVVTMLILGVYLFQQRLAFRSWQEGGNGRSASDWVALGFGLIFVSVALTAALSTGLGHDGISFWALKGKVIFLEGGWPLVDDSYRWLPHPGYPLLIPVFESWVYFFLGQVDEQAVKVVFALFYIALTSFFYGAVRHHFGTLLSLVFTGLMAATPQLATVAALSGYADVALMFYVFAAAALAYDWFTVSRPKGAKTDLWLAVTLSALAVWVKREGLIYGAVIQGFLGLWLLFGWRSRPWLARLRETAVPLGVSFFIVAPWLIYLRWAQIPNVDFTPMTLSGLLAHAERLPIIAAMWQRMFLQVGEWGVLWLLALLVVVWRWRQLGQAANFFLLVAFAGPLLLFAFSFVYSTWEPFTAHMNVSIARLVLHTTPLTWYLIAVLSTGLDDWLRQLIKPTRLTQ